ncbi:hypothetical protein [Serratia sp. FGI94]|uniref:hypothetical protein n=1 Tax=Serratia sp. FGI94 TaxID=671990 RepID=UPI000F4EB3B7|nr:hypothetical protein [Serratia sp. FGI94]
MKKALLVTLLLITSSSAFAGNPMSDGRSCDADYYPNKIITGINNSSNWLDNGPGFNIKIDGAWYGKSVSEDTKGHLNGLYQTAMVAYLLKKPVNVCLNGGRLRGLELN